MHSLAACDGDWHSDIITGKPEPLSRSGTSIQVQVKFPDDPERLRVNLQGVPEEPGPGPAASDSDPSARERLAGGPTL